MLYINGEWKIYRFNNSEATQMILMEDMDEMELTNTQIFDNLLMEFKLMKG